MKKQAILSVLGPDRVGIANDLTAALGRLGLRIETSRMTALQGRFAALMSICGEQRGFTNLRLNLGKLGADLGFELQLGTSREVEKALPKKVRRAGRDLLIESFSADPAGLNVITEILKRRCVNIEEMETEVSSAPCADNASFYMRARVEVPESCSLRDLDEELHELEQDRDINVRLKPGPRLRRRKTTTTR